MWSGGNPPAATSSEDGEIGEEEGEIVSASVAAVPLVAPVPAMGTMSLVEVPDGVVAHPGGGASYSALSNTPTAPNAASIGTAGGYGNVHLGRHYPILNSNVNTPEPAISAPPGRLNYGAPPPNRPPPPPWNPEERGRGGGGWRGRGGGFRGGRGGGMAPRHASFGGPPGIPPPNKNARSQSYGPASVAPVGNLPPPAALHRGASTASAIPTGGPNNALPNHAPPARPTDPRFRGGPPAMNVASDPAARQPSFGTAAMSPLPPRHLNSLDAYGPPRPNNNVFRGVGGGAPPPTLPPGAMMEANSSSNTFAAFAEGDGVTTAPFRRDSVRGPVGLDGGSDHSNSTAASGPFAGRPPMLQRRGSSQPEELSMVTSADLSSYRPPLGREGSFRGPVGGGGFRGPSGNNEAGGFPGAPGLRGNAAGPSGNETGGGGFRNNSAPDYYGPPKTGMGPDFPGGPLRRSPSQRGGGGGRPGFRVGVSGLTSGLPAPPLGGGRDGPPHRRNDPRFHAGGGPKNDATPFPSDATPMPPQQPAMEPPRPPPGDAPNASEDFEMVGSATGGFGGGGRFMTDGPPFRRGSSASLPGGNAHRAWSSESDASFARMHQQAKIPNRPSPHSTPEDRKPPLKMFQPTANVAATSPPIPPNLTTTAPSLPPPTDAPSNPSPSVVNAIVDEPPPPLLTSALGEDFAGRAEKVVKEVEDVLQVPSSDTGSFRKLPSKQQILQALAKMDAKIKSVQKEVEECKVEMEQAMDEEKLLRQKAEEDAVAEAERQVEMQLQMELEQRVAEEKAHGAEIQSFIDEKKQIFEAEQAKVLAELEMKLKTIKDDEEKKMREALNEQMITTADNFDRDIVQMKKELEKATLIAQKTEVRLSSVEKDFKAKLEESGKEGPLDVSPKPTDLVSRIIADNRRKAAEAHLNQLIFVSQDEDSDSEPAYADLEFSKDPSLGKTTSEWADLTRQIMGPADALYSEPSEAPYYAHNEEMFKQIGPLVQEYVRHKQNKLKKHWMELAEEYDYRRTVYKEELLSKTQSREKPKKSLSVPVKHSILQGGKPNQPILESGGVRTSSNPYRRARRGNEVRSEYEQEQIIAEIAAKEAMEKRITFGGTDLPRQVGRLERELTCQYYNTFTAQRIDILEQERELKLCNVWSDMEKSIFLDRWLQFPKDFRKIASFLRNKTTKDCVQFYYDSKQSVPYKGALREQVMRRKRRGDHNVWTSTAEAALSVGATVEAGTSEEKPLVFFLPERDDTYFTRFFHPMQREVYDAMVIDEEAAADYDEDFDENSKSGTSRKRPREPLFTLDPEQSKFLKETTPPPSVKGASQSRSSMALTDGNLTDDGTKDDGGPTPMRRAPQKWSAHEKAVFLETLEKHGRNWSMLSQAIGTKTISQIKNYFYDYKKQAGRGRSDKKSGGNGDSDDKTASRDDDNMTPTPDDAGSIPPTHAEAQLSHNESDQGQVSDNSFHNLPLQPGQYQSHPLLPVHGPQHIPDSHYHHIGSGDLRMARALQQENERSIPQSGTSTPDRMDLWTQARHLQNEEAARQLLLQHHSQTQQQQILSTLLPWINSGHVGTNSLQDQQIQSYLHLQQQQQSTQNPYNSLAALGLGGLSGYGSAGLAGLGPQQHHQPQHRHNRQSSHEAQVVLAQHLLNLHAQGNGSAADALGLLARLPDPNRNNNNNQGGNF